MEVIIAHGSGGGLGLLAFFPAGLLLLLGLVLILSPVASQNGRPVVREEDEDDLASRLLGEEQARELRRRGRRRRAVRRRTQRVTLPGKPDRGDGGDETSR
jgi:hypothetical protein